MLNFKAAASVASVATVTVLSAITTIKHFRKEAVVIELQTEVLSPEIRAFAAAQSIVSQRTLDGYYDDKEDAEMRRDFDVLYATYLHK